MIHSKFILDILNLLLDRDSDGLLARKQIEFLTDTEYEYTGAGLFVSFSHSDEVYKFRLSKDTLVLDGVEIKSSDLAIGADALVFFKEGIVDFLEIWSYDGNYPKAALNNYTLAVVPSLQ